MRRPEPHARERESRARKPLFVAAVGVLVAVATAAWRFFSDTNSVKVSHQERVAKQTNLEREREKPSGPRHEPFHISIVGVSAVLIMCAITGLIIHGVLWDWIKQMPGSPTIGVITRKTPAGAASLEFGRFEPRLQVNPKEDLSSYMAAQQAKLHSYGWVDAKRGIARIPIEMAMQDIVKRGFATSGTSAQVSPLEFQRLRATGNATHK